jgi:hypothetical protein
MSKYIVFKKEIYCPNASHIGYNRYSVKVGDLIRFRTALNDDSYLYEFARVLGLATVDGMGKAYPKRKVLAVLAASNDLSHGFERHVPIDDVVQVFNVGAFTKWFLFGQVNLSIESLYHMSTNGSLSNSYLEKYVYDGGLKIREDWQEMFSASLKNLNPTKESK